MIIGSAIWTQLFKRWIKLYSCIVFCWHNKSKSCTSHLSMLYLSRNGMSRACLSRSGWSLEPIHGFPLISNEKKKHHASLFLIRIYKNFISATALVSPFSHLYLACAWAIPSVLLIPCALVWYLSSKLCLRHSLPFIGEGITDIKDCFSAPKLLNNKYHESISWVILYGQG